MREAQILIELKTQTKFLEENLKRLTSISERHDNQLNSLEKTRTFQKGMLKMGTIALSVIGGLVGVVMWMMNY